jgi:hypothetical protein
MDYVLIVDEAQYKYGEVHKVGTEKTPALYQKLLLCRSRKSTKQGSCPVAERAHCNYLDHSWRMLQH